MNLILSGLRRKSKEKNLNDNEMDYEMGVLLLNFIADFWDIIEQYKLLKSEGKIKGRFI